MRMNVYLQQVKSINTSGLSREQMDQFLQGSEEVQLEVLQQIEDKGGLNTVEVKPVAVKPIVPKIDAEVIADMTGLTEQQVEDVFNGKKEEKVRFKPIEFDHLTHEWGTKPEGIRWCKACGTTREILQAEDADSPCSGVFGLE